MGPVETAGVRQDVHERFAVTDEVDAVPLRRAMAAYALRLGAGPGGVGRAELVVTELATNLARHAKPGGWVLARPVPPSSVELLAVDHGPGMADVGAAVAGRSGQPGGLGRGLAAIRRASTYFDIYSVPGRGTTVLSVVDLHGATRPGTPERLWGGVSIAVAGVCGDGWAVLDVPDGLAVAVVDGLGHGPGASRAADTALDAFAADPTDMSRLLTRANEAMRSTRGGAITVCHLRHSAQELWHVSLGNVNGRILCGGAEHGLVLTSGTLGAAAAPPRVTARRQRWAPGSTLVVWTDGSTSRLTFPADLLAHDPAVVAATLHRDHSRERDDATVVVVRHPGEA